MPTSRKYCLCRPYVTTSVTHLRYGVGVPKDRAQGKRMFNRPVL